MEETLGNTLRASRKAAGISVDDAVYLAKIPRAVVEALEAEDFGFFSSPLYARSFLQQYGTYVGADIEPWLNDLEPTTMIDGQTLESFIDISEPVIAAVTREKPKTSSGSGAWAVLWLVLITGGVIWGGTKIYKNFESKLADPAATDGFKDEPALVDSDPNITVPDELEETSVAKKEEKSVADTQLEPTPRAIPVREE